MQSKRLDRVNQLIKEEISTLLQRELKDPRLGFVTVTEVETSKDLRVAKVFVSVLGDAGRARERPGLRAPVAAPPPRPPRHAGARLPR
jgi:ribosome-binding factor A